MPTETQSTSHKKTALIRYRDETSAMSCPYGETCRIVTGGEGGVANVHVITVTEGKPHLHAGYDEVYYVLSGTGTITFDNTDHELRPGAVVVIPTGIPHSMLATPGEKLEFIIFGSPPMSLDDPLAAPIRPESV